MHSGVESRCQTTGTRADLVAMHRWKRCCPSDDAPLCNRSSSTPTSRPCPLRHLLRAIARNCTSPPPSPTLLLRPQRPPPSAPQKPAPSFAVVPRHTNDSPPTTLSPYLPAAPSHHPQTEPPRPTRPRTSSGSPRLSIPNSPLKNSRPSSANRLDQITSRVESHRTGRVESIARNRC